MNNTSNESIKSRKNEYHIDLVSMGVRFLRLMKASYKENEEAEGVNSKSARSTPEGITQQ
ncbi:hypothetical protein A0J61_04423 [Choanephora cucurbitarum]|uniref:Uncharacterized protein n=1 Tax=Choanephora cucurbitarum TaxID=101091 RepID=A0A1C7NEJ8_9FUNG|nr:hypothetical protein A0J61_04423 [Choanephora cucurbitarum]